MLPNQQLLCGTIVRSAKLLCSSAKLLRTSTNLLCASCDGLWLPLVSLITLQYLRDDQCTSVM